MAYEMIENEENEFRLIRKGILDLDFEALYRIKERNLPDLNDDDLKCLGLKRLEQVESKIYCCKDIFGVNRYYNRAENGELEYLCCNQGCKMKINCTKELIMNAIFNWRFKGLGLISIE